MRIKKDFVIRDVFGNHVVFGEGLNAIDFKRLETLNETATFIWECAQAQEDFSIESLSDALCKEYEVSHDTAVKDVTNLVRKWQKLKMIEE